MSDRQLRWQRVAAVAFAVVTAYAIFGSYVVAAAVLGFRDLGRFARRDGCVGGRGNQTAA